MLELAAIAADALSCELGVVYLADRERLARRTSAAGRSRCPRDELAAALAEVVRARRVPLLRPGRRRRGRCPGRSRTSAGSARTTCSS